MADRGKEWELLERVFDRFNKRSWKGSAARYEKARFDFAFHMLDWRKDMEELQELFRHPEKEDLQLAAQKIFGFLIHVIPHLDTAGKLLVGKVSNPFAERPKKRKRSKLAAAS